MWRSLLNDIWKFLKQNVLFPKGLDWERMSAYIFREPLGGGNQL